MLKKRIFCLFLAVWLITGAIVSLCACNGDGDDDGTEPPDDAFDPYPYEDLSVFMDLPDYKNITLEGALVDRMVNTELAYFCRDKSLDVQIYDGGALKWDVADLTVKGFVDGEIDYELCSEGIEIVLGSASFYIDGLEQGVIGMEVGESKTVDLTFPTDYPGTKYAGKNVQYHVTLNALYRAPTLTDAMVSQNTCFDSADEYVSWVRSRCIFLYVWDGLVTKCVIKSYPSEYTEYYQYLKGTIQQKAEDAGYSLADFISKFGDAYGQYGLFSGMTLIDLEDVCTNYARSNLVNDLLTYSIVRAEGIKTEGAEFEAAKVLLTKDLGGISYEAVVASQGETEAIISVLSIRLCRVINSYVTVTNE